MAPASRQWLGNGSAIGVADLGQLAAQTRKLDTAPQAPLEPLLGGQIGRLALLPAGLGVAVHAASVQTQVLRNGVRHSPVVEQEQYRHEHVPRLTPTGALRLPQPDPL